MKVVSFYLPQFHEIEENNEWWGKGFTEWDNTKKAKKLFEGHHQPKTPLENNYYDLSDSSVMEEQAKIARIYGVDTFAFYHYWFGGKKLLEKPIENFLNNKNIDISFCLSWANEPWTRSWDGKNKSILIEQNYGDEDSWKEHYEYLHNFFSDERYLRIKEEPVFIIYRPSSIPRCTEMLDYFNELAKENGFKGIHFIEMLTSFENKIVDGFNACLEFEPMYTMKHHMPLRSNIIRAKNQTLNNFSGKSKLFKNKFLDIVSYEEVWKSIISRKNGYRRKNHYLGSFVNWDNSARKKQKALMLKGFSPMLFEKYNKIQIKKARDRNDELFFINAWNEWAEGTYLEPDNLYGFQVLEAFSRSLNEEEVL